MSFVPESINLPRAAATFLRASGVDTQKVQLGIHEADQMYAHSLAVREGDKDKALIDYYRTGLCLFDSVKQIVNWHFGSFNQVGSFLDFACGYGRFGRFMANALPPKRIWCSDIYRAAVEFQSAYFGVNGQVSVNDPAGFPDNPKFDCILAVSFFTHVPDSTFAQWLSKLYGLLNPGGLLIFSVHDMETLDPESRPTGASICFNPGSYDSQLPASDFGGTYVTEDYVRNALREGVGGEHVQRIKAGFDFLQDVYVVTNALPARPLEFQYFPFGHFESWTTAANGDLCLMGCATDHFNNHGGIESVELKVDDKVIQTCVPDRDWPEIAEYFRNQAALRSGWSMTVKPAYLKTDDIAVLLARNRRNREYVFHCGTLDSVRRT